MGNTNNAASVNKRAFVKLDKNNRVVSSVLVKRKHKPKNGNWVEIPENMCCNAGGVVVVDITALTLASDATVTIDLGCGLLKVSQVLITTTGGTEALKRANLVTQLTSIFGAFGTFVLAADNNSITFTSDNLCLDPVFTITP